MQSAAHALGDTAADLQVNPLALGTASGDLVLQLGQLGSSGRGLVTAAQPVAQHVGLARVAQGLQSGNLRRHAHGGQVLLR